MRARCRPDLHDRAPDDVPSVPEGPPAWGARQPPGAPGGGVSGFDVGEDVGFADAGAGDRGVPPVGPDRVDVGAADRDAVVVADECPAAEEPEVGVPGPGADPAAGPAGPAVGGPGLPGVDVDVTRVEPPVEPDRVQVAVAGPGDPREELVVARGLPRAVDRQEPGVGPVLSAVGGPLDGN